MVWFLWEYPVIFEARVVFLMYLSPQFDWYMAYLSQIIIPPDRSGCHLHRCICSEGLKIVDSSAHQICWCTIALWLIWRRGGEVPELLICSFSLLIGFRNLMSFSLKWNRLLGWNRLSEGWSWSLLRGSWLSCLRGRTEPEMPRKVQVGRDWVLQLYNFWYYSMLFQCII